MKDDLIGTVIGHITVLRKIPGTSGKHHEYLCQCHCGNKPRVRSSWLRYSRDNNKDRTCGICCTFVAGDPYKGKALYNMWRAMIKRCYKVTLEDNPHSYSRYRGRGIRVCKA